MGIAFLKKAKIISSAFLLLAIFGNFNLYGMEEDMKNSSEQKRGNSFFRWNPLSKFSKPTTPPVEKKSKKFSLQRSISVPDGCVSSLSSVDHSAEVAQRETHAREPYSRKYVKNHVSYLQASLNA